MHIAPRVWYACYGSNLRADRFFTYLKGGPPPDVLAEAFPQWGSRNPNLPTNDSHETDENWQVTFRGGKSRWGVGGVAFLEPRDTQNPIRPSVKLRLWLIEFHQYVDVYLQENGINPKSLSPSQMQAVEKWLTDIVQKDDWETISVPDNSGMPKELLTSRYQRVIRLDDHNDIPVFSFTSPDDHDVFSAPSIAYARTIGIGLLETFPDANAQNVADYLYEVTTLRNIEALAAEVRNNLSPGPPRKARQLAITSALPGASAGAEQTMW